MKIAHVAPLHESVPPAAYGGTERIVSYLTEALVDLGHDVTLFASGDSRTSARLVAARDTALRLDPRPLKSEIAAHLAMLHEVRRRAREFDVVHFHLSHFLHFPFFEDMAGRTVTTPHGRLDYVDLAPAYRRFPSFPMISISRSQRARLPDANWIATVPHGLPLALYEPDYEAGADGAYLAFLGRLSRDKRPDRAIEIARRTGLKLKLAAKIGDDDRAYFREVADHHLEAREAIASFDDMLSNIMQASMARVSLDENADMRKISAAVAILAVPTTIGAVYGMNFDYMPELHTHYGYFFVLAAMATAMLITYGFFRRRHWL